jgi:hypothetical protein
MILTMTTSPSRIFTPQNLKRAGLVVAAYWTIQYAGYYATVEGPVSKDNRSVGGDFHCFYAAGKTILEGHGPNLYNPDFQLQFQARSLNNRTDHILCPYVNPPTLAIACAPIAALPYFPAFHLHTALMLISGLVSLAIIKKHIPTLHQHWTAVVLLSLTFYPSLRATIGGQNTMLSLLLITLIFDGLITNKPHRAGIALGMLFFKPHFAITLFILIAVGKHYRTLKICIVTALSEYAIAAAICGPAWPLDMLKEVRRYLPAELIYNGPTDISLMGALQYAWQAPQTAAGIAFAVAIFITLIIKWRATTLRACSDQLPGRQSSTNDAGARCLSRTFSSGNPFPHFVRSMLLSASSMRRTSSRQSSITNVSSNLNSLWALTLTGIIAASPHTQFYDLGIVIPAVLLTLDHLKSTNQPIPSTWIILLVAAYTLTPFFRISTQIGFQPLAFIAPLIFIWTLSATFPSPVQNLQPTPEPQT